MPKFRITGDFRRTLHFSFINEEIEAETEDDAIDQLCESYDSDQASMSDDDTYNLKAEEVEDESDIPEDRKLRRMGAPMLPGMQLA